MKIVAFLGSPRLNGNTEILLEEALKALKGTRHRLTMFKLNFMNIKPCQDCGGCEKNGACVLRDDMTDVYPAIREADRIILASPIFFFGLSAQAKIMIDRCQSFWCEKYLLHRPLPEGRHGRKGLLLLVGGMKKEIGIKCSEACAKAFFRTVSVPDHHTVSVLGADAKGSILDHHDALQKAYEACKKLIE